MIDRESVATAYPVAKGLALSVGPLADFDDGPLRDFDTEPAALTARDRLSVMLEIMQRDTGNAVSPERATAALRRNEELRRQTVEIATRLERMGIPAFRETPFSLYTYFVQSGAVLRNDQFRRRMILPLVAQNVRRPKVTALESFCERHPFARMWTFTSGVRCTLADLRDRITTLHRKLSKLASWLRHRWGVEMVFRSTELGKPERRNDGTIDAENGTIERDTKGEATFHPHAHTLVWQKRPLRREQWSQMLREVWDRWGHHWDDGASVRDARELAKYPFKPATVLGLTDTELAALARSLEGLRMVVPMGTLRAEIRDRKEREVRFDRQPTSEGRVLREVPDWNRWGKRPDTAFTASGPAKLTVGTESFDVPPIEKAIDYVLTSHRAEPEDVPARIVARLAPGFAPGSLIAEPRVGVLAFKWDAAQVAGNPLVVQLRDATADAWNRARASALRVHVCTSTVPAFFDAAADWHSRRPPDVPEAAQTAAN